MWLGLGKYFDVCLAAIKMMNYLLHLFHFLVLLVNVAQLLTTNLMEAVNFLRKVVENLEPHFVVKVIFCSFPLPFCTSATAAPAHNGSLPDSTLSLLWAQNGNQSYCIQEKGVLHEPNKKSLENMITRTRKGFLMVFSPKGTTPVKSQNPLILGLLLVLTVATSEVLVCVTMMGAQWGFQRMVFNAQRCTLYVTGSLYSY